MSTVYGYARCSTDVTRQDIDRQKRELRRLGVADDSHIYWEYESGLVNARAKGKTLGRPRVSEETVPGSFWRYYSRYRNGELTVTELARLMECSRTTVYKYIRVAEDEK